MSRGAFLIGLLSVSQLFKALFAEIIFFVFQSEGDKSPAALKEVAMRRSMVALAVAFLLSFSGGRAWGQAQYTVTDLGTLANNVAGTTSYAYGINASGKVVGSILDKWRPPARLPLQGWDDD